GVAVFTTRRWRNRREYGQSRQGRRCAEPRARPRPAPRTRVRPGQLAGSLFAAAPLAQKSGEHLERPTRPKAVSPYAADAVASAALSRAPEGGGLNPRPAQAALDDCAIDVFQGTERICAFGRVLFRLCQFLADGVKLGIQSAFGL